MGQISRKVIGQKDVQSPFVPPLALPSSSFSARLTGWSLGYERRTFKRECVTSRACDFGLKPGFLFCFNITFIFAPRIGVFCHLSIQLFFFARQSPALDSPGSGIFTYWVAVVSKHCQTGLIPHPAAYKIPHQVHLIGQQLSAGLPGHLYTAPQSKASFTACPGLPFMTALLTPVSFSVRFILVAIYHTMMGGEETLYLTSLLWASQIRDLLPSSPFFLSLQSTPAILVPYPVLKRAGTVQPLGLCPCSCSLCSECSSLRYSQPHPLTFSKSLLQCHLHEACPDYPL